MINKYSNAYTLTGLNTTVNVLPESPNTRSNRLLYPCLCPSSLAHSPRQCRHPLWTSPVGPPKAPPPSSPQYPNLSPRTRFPKFGAISLTHPSRALTSSSSFLTHHTPPSPNTENRKSHPRVQSSGDLGPQWTGSCHALEPHTVPVTGDDSL